MGQRGISSNGAELRERESLNGHRLHLRSDVDDVYRNPL